MTIEITEEISGYSQLCEKEINQMSRQKRKANMTREKICNKYDRVMFCHVKITHKLLTVKLYDPNREIDKGYENIKEKI